MDPIKALAEEHVIIVRALDALEGYLGRVAAGDAVPPEELGRFASFFVKFADLNHHEKEEDLLLPTLERAGLAWDSPALHGVRNDHRQERYLVTELNNSWSRDGEWTPENRRHVDSIGREFVAFQRKHIALEEDELMPLATQMLDANALAELGTKFAEFSEYFGQDAYDELVESAKALHQRYASATTDTRA